MGQRIYCIFISEMLSLGREFLLLEWQWEMCISVLSIRAKLGSVFFGGREGMVSETSGVGGGLGRGSAGPGITSRQRGLVRW